MSAQVWDVAVVGAGAAGLMAAIAARAEGARVLLLDAKEKVGAKILMSGGTRCNVTNKTVTERDFEAGKKFVLKSVLKSFSSEKALEFFRSIGVECVLEPGGKYFPVTHSSRTVLEALLRECTRLGVEMETFRKIIHAEKGEEFFVLKTRTEDNYRARTVILATGGLSYPGTGSDGTGYELASSFGHTLIRTTPALTPLKSRDQDWTSLSGLSLPVRLTFRQADEKVSFEDDFLFTHFGFSGPAALNVSRYWLRAPESDRKITASFLPARKEDEFRELIKNETLASPSRTLKNFLCGFFAERFTEVLLKKVSVTPSLVLNQLSRESREALIRVIFNCELSVYDSMGYAKAEVTAGGIDLLEVDRLTLESLKQKGLFFAGEILDVDGRIGGFNFQWAWASGRLAGMAAARTAAVRT